jgi:beta-glucosidase/6-phospho-beta-glucosidase/beta-galactosidase
MNPRPHEASDNSLPFPSAPTREGAAKAPWRRRRVPPARAPVFDSFFFAGFEGTATRNAGRQWIDQVSATGHDRHADADYRRLREAGLLAARECMRWPLIDRRGRLDFSSVRPFLEAARRHRIEVVWDLFHYGYPEDLDPFSDDFVQRFAAYCGAAARLVGERAEDRVCYFTPVNEPSFLAWAGGAVGRFSPHLQGRGPDLKIALIRAAIAGIDAIRAELPNARMINADPLCRVVPPRDHPDPHADAEDFNQRAVYECWDMLCGRLMPELGGSRRHLDIVGVNYYWTNQWEIGAEERPLQFDDPRRWPLSRLLRQVWRRYGGELIISETSHVDDMRPIWLRTVADECEKLLEEGVPLRGVCLYPVLGMPEWHEPENWARMGLWDLEPRGDSLERRPYVPMFEALREVRRIEGRFAEFRRPHGRGDSGAIAEPTGESIDPEA